MHSFQTIYKQPGLLGAIGVMTLLHPAASAQIEGYLDQNALRDSMKSIANESSYAQLGILGKSLDGNPIEY